MGGLLHLGLGLGGTEEGTGWGPSPPRPLLAVPNVTAHPCKVAKTDAKTHKKKEEMVKFVI